MQMRIAICSAASLYPSGRGHPMKGPAGIHRARNRRQTRISLSFTASRDLSSSENDARRRWTYQSAGTPLYGGPPLPIRSAQGPQERARYSFVNRRPATTTNTIVALSTITRTLLSAQRCCSTITRQWLPHKPPLSSHLPIHRRRQRKRQLVQQQHQLQTVQRCCRRWRGSYRSLRSRFRIY